MQIIETLHKSEIFKSTQLDGFNLVHLFQMFSQNTQPHWQISYYNKDTKSMITFHMNEQITVENHTQLATLDEKQILPLHIEEVSISFEKAKQITEECIAKEHKKLPTTTQIFLLQHIPLIGIVWNITYVTNDFKTINVKIDAKTGEIKLQNVNSLLDMHNPL